MNSNEVTERIIGAAITVHKQLGPGLLESAYEGCLALELAHLGIKFRQQVPISLVYRSQPIEAAYRIDFVVEHKVIVEIKAVAAIDLIHGAQLLTYMKLSKLRVGLLINFNVHLLKDGIRRVVLDFPDVPQRPQRPLR